ncbi:MAG: hypothetical protein EBR76_05810, partial [Actinobacteria bacterium]|nr:hypothetical protein [Actinomycetota bacterium]
MASASDRVAIVWFRRDLRLSDHPALSDAIANSDAIIPLFILDEKLIKHAGTKRLAYMANSLRALDQSLNNKLHIRVGDQVAVLDADTSHAIALVASARHIINETGKVVLTRRFSRRLQTLSGNEAVNRVIRSGGNGIGEGGAVMFRASLLQKA